MFIYFLLNFYSRKSWPDHKNVKRVKSKSKKTLAYLL